MNRTSYRLNLNAWSSGGCPILGGSVEYRSIRQKHWSSLPVPSLLDPVILSDLSPDDLYKVRVSMKNSAGATSVEYEIRSLDSKNVFQKNPFEVPHLISLGTFHSPATEMEGPGHVTDVLIVSLTLLLTTLAAVAILYKTIQRKFVPAGEARGARSLAVAARSPKTAFMQSSAREAFVLQPSELTGVALEKRFHANKLSTSASDTGFNLTCNVMGNSGGSGAAVEHGNMGPGVQYLTLGRRGNGVMMEEYAMVRKGEAGEVPRYTVPVTGSSGQAAVHSDSSGAEGAPRVAFCDHCGLSSDGVEQEWRHGACELCGDKTPSLYFPSIIR